MCVTARHGYTPADLYELARYAVTTDRWRPSINWDERVDAAYCAMTEAVWTSNDVVPRRELVFVGRNASAEVVRDDMRHHGLDKRGARFGEERVNFARFWTDLPGCAVEDRVVDRVSLSQIWVRLKPTYQEALVALATWRDYSKAASTLGLEYHAFCARVRHARTQFLRLWHEGEQPSKLWGRDKLRGRDCGRSAVRVHRRRRVKTGAAVEGGGPT
jgi:hypothetical protein